MLNSKCKEAQTRREGEPREIFPRAFPLGTKLLLPFRPSPPSVLYSCLVAAKAGKGKCVVGDYFLYEQAIP